MSPRQRTWLALAAIGAVIIGFRAFQFLCDDAYIEFRYVLNAHRGHGFVWNPPPFRPVEGYTSFLWVALLTVIWNATGVAPPVAAPVLSLGLSIGTVLLVVHAAIRLPLNAAWAPHRQAVAWGVLVATLSNRAFLAFTSSGLETPLWTFVLAAWGYAFVVAQTPALGVAALAAVAALVRPDGLLLAAGTAAWIAWRAARERRLGLLWAWTPFVVVALHLLWRMDTYGFWLPNTYYAKHVAPWPVMGALYVASFVWEFGYWPQAVLLGWALVLVVRRRAWPSLDRRATWAFGLVGAHWAYYTFDVGGDHFEYRVYHHWVPLLALLSPVLAGMVGGPVRRWARVFVGCWLFGLVIPWTHYAKTWDWAETHHEIKDRKGAIIVPVAKNLWPIYPYAWVWDRLQFTLNARFIGLRWHVHRTFLEYQKDRWHMVDEGPPPAPDGDVLLLAYTSIGWPSWAFPDWAIIDNHGLNDVVIARQPATHSGQWDRIMAHDRNAPPKYVRCFRPNLIMTPEGVLYKPRLRPLTADEIRACEAQFAPKD